MGSDRDETLLAINNRLESLQIIQSIVRHDVGNALEELGFSADSWDLEGDLRRSPDFFSNLAKQVRKLQHSVELLSHHEDSQVCLSRVVLPVVINCDLLENTTFENFSSDSVETDPRVLISVVKNILDNSREAYERLYKNKTGLKIVIQFVDKNLSISDNAGGLDPSNVKYGNSTKGSTGHGQFLSTMKEKSHVFGFSFVIERIPNGTKVTLGFNK